MQQLLVTYRLSNQRKFVFVAVATDKNLELTTKIHEHIAKYNFLPPIEIRIENYCESPIDETHIIIPFT